MQDPLEPILWNSQGDLGRFAKCQNPRSPPVTQPRVALLSKRPSLQRVYRRDPLDLFAATGWNTGNLAFIHAVSTQIQHDVVYYDWDFDPDEVNAECDFVVLVCANMLSPILDLTALAQSLDKLRTPLSALSIGVQGTLGAMRFPLQAGTRRVIETIAASCVSFGIRGARAADWLDGMAIHNWRIVGCPSNFLNPDPGLGARVLASSQVAAAPKHLAVHVDWLENDDTGQAMRHMRQIIHSADLDYFVQAPLGLIEIARLRPPATPTPAQMDRLTNVFGWSEEGDLFSFVRRHIRSFFDVECWMDALGQYEASVGFRLHGNILAHQAGVPSVIIAHDERVAELAEAIAMPAVRLPDFYNFNSIGTLMDAALPTLATYDARRAVLATTYLQWFRENGLNPSADLTTLAQSVPSFAVESQR